MSIGKDCSRKFDVQIFGQSMLKSIQKRLFEKQLK